MSFLGYIIFSAGLADIMLAIYPFLSGRRRPIAILFSFVSVVIAYWTITNPLMVLTPTLFWVKNSYAAGVLVPPVVFIWVMMLVNRRLSVSKVALALIPALILFFITYWTDGVIFSVRKAVIGGFEGKFGPLFPVFAIYSLLMIVLIFLLLIHGFKSSIGIQRTQLKFTAFGLIGFGICVSIVSFILPLFFNFDQFIPLDSPSSLFFIVSIGYAIFRYKLLDVRVVITRSLLYGLLVTLVALSFILVTFFSANYFGGTPVSRNIVSFIVAVVIVAGLDPLKRLLSRATDKIFFKAKIDYAAVLRQLAEILSVELNLGRLITNLTSSLQEQLKIKSAVIALRKPNQNPADAFIAKPPTGRTVSLPVSNPLVKHINERQSPSILEVLERKIEELAEGTERKRLEQSRKMFEDLGAAVIAPIVAQGKLIALLVLGPKLSGESFGNDDLQLIEVLGPQIGSAIQKANLYEEVRAFGERLKKRVEEATAELKERNVSLLTLQTITRDVTRTLDFNKVVQNIADSVANRLGYVGAVLVFVDDDGHTVRARAITNTPLTAKATKLLPKHFSEYATDLTNQKDRNLANDVITSGQVRFTEDFAEVISPPVPQPIAWAIQKLIGVKTIVVMPITSEQKVIGAIEIGLKKAQEDISEREIETMQSVADQLGVVARNLKLFEQVKLANAELEDANRHLQQLDQAKSEFVSIASHQLRTPMTGIMGYLSMLTSGDFGQLKVEHVRILKNLLQESQRMIRLINLFLNVTKIEAGKFEFHPVPIDLVDLVDREIREVAKLAEEKKLKLVFDRPQKPLPQVLADPDKLQDVLLNLIDNAIKYTREGSVTVRVEHGPGELVVSVHDTGVGIPKDQVSELFNKFVRGSGIARLHPDGSGLGLFIAKRIIEGHRGRIWVESEGEGRGSTFRFSLPLAH